MHWKEGVEGCRSLASENNATLLHDLITNEVERGNCYINIIGCRFVVRIKKKKTLHNVLLSLNEHWMTKRGCGGEKAGRKK